LNGKSGAAPRRGACGVEGGVNAFERGAVSCGGNGPREGVLIPDGVDGVFSEGGWVGCDDCEAVGWERVSLRKLIFFEGPVREIYGLGAGVVDFDELAGAFFGGMKVDFVDDHGRGCGCAEAESPEDANSLTGAGEMEGAMERGASHGVWRG
jgi:hypothetical protein